LSKLPLEALAEGIDLDFEEMEEHWNSYRLSDGTTLKVRLILRGVKRLKGFEPDGMPIYAITSINVVRAVDVPEGLRARPKKSEIPPV